MQITRPRAVLLAVSILLLGTFILTRRGTAASSSAQDDDEFAAALAAVASVDAYVASCKAAKERYGYSLDGDVSVVRPWLAIGGRPDAKLMEWRDGDRRITHIVNALEREEEPEVSEAYGDNILKLNLKDDGDDARFAELLPDVVAFVRQARAADPNAVVYVHCKSGVNRAPSLAMALLIAQRATFVEALAAVRAARPSCRPKYVKAVAMYEDRELGRSTAPALRDGVDSAGFCDLYYGLKEDYSGGGDASGERWRSGLAHGGVPASETSCLSGKCSSTSSAAFALQTNHSMQTTQNGMLVVGSRHLFTALQAFGGHVAFAELPDWDKHLGQKKISSMQPLLDYAMPLLQQYISEMNPLWLVVHSKGVSVACELARLNLWRGRTLISAPIINPSEALAEDDYEGMAHLLNESARIDFAVGMDEQDLIMEAGLKAVALRHGWQVHMFYGGHWWYSDQRNRMRLGKILTRLEAA